MRRFKRRFFMLEKIEKDIKNGCMLEN